MSKRSSYRTVSNNVINPNQNVCALHVAKALGVAAEVRYLHTAQDVFRAARLKYSVRSVATAVKSKTVGGARKHMTDIAAEFFIVVVAGHVLLLDTDGQTIVDTDPRKRDARKIKHVMACYPK